MEKINDYVNNADEGKESLNKEIIVDNNDDKQTLFSFFGIELTAPKGLKNPRIIYISFIAVNLFILILLKSFISK